MSQIKIKSWPFSPNEQVTLYWLCSPTQNSAKNWVMDAYFLQAGQTSPAPPILFDWGTLPSLRVGRTYSNGRLSKNDPGINPQKISIPNFRNGTICKGFDLPPKFYPLFRDKNLGLEKLWRFKVENITYYIPCIEIVRTFLTPLKTLANQLLEPNGIGALIEGEAIVNGVLKLDLHSDFPRTLVNRQNVAHLAWIRHDPAAKECWDYVYRHIFSEAIKLAPTLPATALSTGIKIEVLPPIKSPCELVFNGITSDEVCLIKEIIGIGRLPRLPFRKIIYSHPSFKKYESEGSANTNVVEMDDYEDFELDDSDEPASHESHQPVAKVPRTAFDFIALPEMEQAVDKVTKPTGSPTRTVFITPERGDNKRKRVDPEVSTKKPVYGGTVKPIEFSGIDLKDLPEIDGLKQFLQAIQQIELKYSEPLIKSNLVEMLGDKTFVTLTDGKRRTCAITEVIQAGVAPCLILEVARPDSWSISTLFVQSLSAPTGCSLSDLACKLIDELADHGGHWSEDLDKDESLRVRRLRHLSDPSIYRWSSRIIEKLALLGFSPKRRKS